MLCLLYDRYGNGPFKPRFQPFCMLSWVVKETKSSFFLQNLKEFQTPRENNLLSGMITDQLNFYNIDKHKSSSCCFYVYNSMASLWIRDKIKIMRVCKSCHNNMITVVNCDRTRPLIQFWHEVTAAIFRWEFLCFGKYKHLLLFGKVNMVAMTTFFKLETHT